MAYYIRNDWTCRECGNETSLFNDPVTRYNPFLECYYETGLCDTCANLYHTDETEIFNGDPCGKEKE